MMTDGNTIMMNAAVYRTVKSLCCAPQTNNIMYQVYLNNKIF